LHYTSTFTHLLTYLYVCYKHYKFKDEPDEPVSGWCETTSTVSAIQCHQQRVNWDEDVVVNCRLDV